MIKYLFSNTVDLEGNLEALALDGVSRRVNAIKGEFLSSMVKDINTFVPLDTGYLQRSATTNKSNMEIKYSAEYASEVYYMDQDRISQAKNPLATSHWLDYAIEAYQPIWSAVLKDKLGG